MIARHGLGFAVASDPGYALARHLGITFFPEDQPAAKPENWIGARLGTNSYEITKPAVVIVNADGPLRHLEASPDWLVRTEAEAVLAHLPEVAAVSAAA